MIKKKSWKEVRKSHEFIILVISVMIVTFFWVDWGKFHYGNNVKVVYIDSSKLKKDKPQDRIAIPKVDTQKTTLKTVRVIRPSKVKQILKDNSKKNKPVSTSKYDLSNATVSQSAVGDNSSVTNNIYVNSEMQLKTSYLEKIYRQVDSIHRNYNAPKVIRTGALKYCNIPSACDQIADYLQERGYEIKSRCSIAFSINTKLIGVMYEYDDYAINITIGKFY